MIKVRVLGGGDYKAIFDAEPGYEVVEDKSFDLLVFTGGTDVSTSLYHQERHPYTHIPDTKRDQQEQDFYRFCRLNRIPMVGICRGSQFLTVMNDGSLYQDVSGHGTPHEIETSDGRVMVATSSHHQMMNVWSAWGEIVGRAEILAWSSVKRSDSYEVSSEIDGMGGIIYLDPPPVEPEVVLFPRTRCLCHQPHPEWMQTDAPYRRYFFETLNDLMTMEDT